MNEWRPTGRLSLFQDSRHQRTADFNFASPRWSASKSRESCRSITKARPVGDNGQSNTTPFVGISKAVENRCVASDWPPSTPNIITLIMVFLLGGWMAPRGFGHSGLTCFHRNPVRAPLIPHGAGASRPRLGSGAALCCARNSAERLHILLQTKVNKPKTKI